MKWTALNGVGAISWLAGIVVWKNAAAPGGSVFGASAIYVALVLAIVGIATLLWANVRMS